MHIPSELTGSLRANAPYVSKQWIVHVCWFPLVFRECKYPGNENHAPRTFVRHPYE